MQFLVLRCMCFLGHLPEAFGGVLRSLRDDLGVVLGSHWGDLLAIKSPSERRISRLLLPLAPGCPRVSFLIDFGSF